jgi:uncharacterized lipoprotein YehR (DUF1307 family)
MKKLNVGLVLCMLWLTILSCGGSKEAKKYEKSINGTWVLNNVTTEGITGKIKAQILEEAAFGCFDRSIWKFNTNTNLGSYEIVQNAGECVSKLQNIRWSLYEEKGMPVKLQYKKVDAKRYKDLEADKVGFRFTIVSLTATNMQLKSEVSFEGKPAYFIYNFSKN